MTSPPRPVPGFLEPAPACFLSFSSLLPVRICPTKWACTCCNHVSVQLELLFVECGAVQSSFEAGRSAPHKLQARSGKGMLNESSSVLAPSHKLVDFGQFDTR